MNSADIIRMAREAGLGDTGVRAGFIFFQPGTDGLERFAALVAAAEREACAKLCEARFVGDLNREDMEARRCAAAIRARKSI